MTSSPHVDGVLVQWGERLFYPSNRITSSPAAPRLNAAKRGRATAIRRQIEAVVRRTPQVMVKVTGGGRGMAAIAAHFRYISKNGRLAIEDDRGVVREGKDALHDLTDQWRHGGALIDDIGHRREAYNIMLSMPVGTDAFLLQKAAREFAQAELEGHRYVMVLHEHQANPHVHLSVKASSMSGKRLNPRKTDLQRWRETFAEKLRGWGIEADATRQASRGEFRNFDPLWRVKAKQDGRVREVKVPTKEGGLAWDSRTDAMRSWAHIMIALTKSENADDRNLAEQISAFMQRTPVYRKLFPDRGRDAVRTQVQPRQPRSLAPDRGRSGPEHSR